MPTELVDGAQCAYEIVINGIDEQHVAAATRATLHAAAGEGIPAISAGNYGGKLGKFHFKLREVLAMMNYLSQRRKGAKRKRKEDSVMSRLRG